MTVKEVNVPDIGGSEGVEVIELCVGPGDRVEVDDSLIVLESDKATMEVPSPLMGTVKEIKVKLGDKVSEGNLILLMEEESASSGTEIDAPEASSKVASVSGTESKAPASVPVESEVEVTVPDIGSDSATVIELCVAEGDEVDIDDSLIVLESDKATMEVPSTVKGKVTQVLMGVDENVGEGAPIVRVLATSDAAPVLASPVDAPSAEISTEKTIPPAPQAVPSVGARDLGMSAAGGEHKVHAGPAVRKLAREFGVDLANVPGTGPKGRILKEDVQGYVRQSLKQVAAGGAAGGAGIPEVKLPDFSQFGPVSRRPMTKIHRITAENMHKAWLNVPHVTQFDEADITEMEAFRKNNRALSEKKGIKLTPIAFLLKACAYAIKELPQFNVALDLEKQEVIEKSYIHIGLAVDTPNGLVVPVIRDVDKKGIWELAAEVGSMAQKAKDKKLLPAEMQGGCFTISSLGGIGGTAFTPIVNTPEVAILGVSKSSTKPVWDGAQFVPKLMLPLSLSYDHRAINGADAARFTNMLCLLLGDLRQMLL